MEFPKALLAPARVGLAAAGLGLAAAETSVAVARDAVAMAADRIDPGSAGSTRHENLITAAQRVPYIVHRVSDLLSEDGAIHRVAGPGGAADRVADLFDEGGPVDRVIRPDGPLDRATREGGIVDAFTAEDGVVQKLAEVTDAMNRLTPTIAAMGQRLGDIENVVGAANTVAEPVTDLLSSLPKFALRTANEVAKAAQPRQPRPARVTSSPTAVVPPAPVPPAVVVAPVVDVEAVDVRPASRTPQPSTAEDRVVAPERPAAREPDGEASGRD
ncbi:hypothetical protein [Tsukamurella paurometabola]|uniref:Uncharacterized protein n=1 Tax=Tsukamurella paurometabola TaxID=2061 RepID=A0A3P8L6B7_TSUPA|nr:hypothetical protein [Tsukamurella paurometabola]MBS4100264.1 hypothetical protein [Tsukamurella paurometabola]UEA84307.1 hypothetical protein LK411_05625 [Tsukamurella paurometabola]VDR41485.1 Uncharacterised protein [Tsukamurella paurometabola]